MYIYRNFFTEGDLKWRDANELNTQFNNSR